MSSPQKMSGDLSVTALYTSQTWVWGGLPQAGLFDLKGARNVFRVTNFFYDMARRFRRTVPSMRHSLIHRHLMIDHLLRQALDESGACQVVELAAGLSRRGATFSADPKVRYVEVDLPNVVATKRQLLAGTSEGRAAAERNNWQLVGSDVRDIDLRALVDTTMPVFVIAEGLFMYLDAAEQTALCRRINDAFAECPSVTMVFDLLRHEEEPDPGPVMRAIHRGMKRFTGGQGFRKDNRSRLHIAEQLRDAGFATVQIHEASDVAREWDLPHPEEPTRVVLFHCQRS